MKWIGLICTIVTVIVLFFQTIIFYRQTSILQNQADFAASANRPYIHTSFPNPISQSTTIPLYTENGGGIPASIIYQEEIAAIFSNQYKIRDLAGSHLGNGDITSIYPGGNGIGLNFQTPILGDLTTEESKALSSGSDTIEIASCIIYKPIDQADHRQWEVDEVWLPESEGASPIFRNDSATSSETCDAEPLFAEFKP